MRTPICDELGIEFPIFAFTHCRDVVAAVSRAGGFGVLGAVGFSPEQLEVELQWIDEHVGDHPYGVDIVIPGKYEGMDDMDPEHLAQTLRDMVPQQHLDFAKKVLADRGVPELPEGESNSLQLLGWTEATATPQVQCALNHPKVKLIANALGTPPVEVIELIHDAGRKVAALCGSPYQALKHKEAGVDIVIGQGGEGGGHTGPVPTTLLLPDVVDAVGADIPVLAAGGFHDGRGLVAALAYGADGVAMGTRFLLSAESRVPDEVKQRYLAAKVTDTVVTEALDGAPQRVIRTELVDRLIRSSAVTRLPRAVGNALAFRKVTGTSVKDLAAEGRAMRKSQDLTLSQLAMAANAPMLIKAALVDGDPDVGVLPTGQVTGLIDSLPPVADILEAIVTDARATLTRLAGASSGE